MCDYPRNDDVILGEFAIGIRLEVELNFFSHLAIFQVVLVYILHSRLLRSHRIDAAV